MTVYAVKHVTWNDGALADFELPRILGYYATEERARIARRDFMTQVNDRELEQGSTDFVSRVDVDIEPITVVQ